VDKTMHDQEKIIEDLEAQIPRLSGVAVKLAYERALASGQSVYESDKGAIYEIFPDGSRKFVKNIEPSQPVKPGQIITIR
jgi:hypothetical protein